MQNVVKLRLYLPASRIVIRAISHDPVILSRMSNMMRGRIADTIFLWQVSGQTLGTAEENSKIASKNLLLIYYIRHSHGKMFSSRQAGPSVVICRFAPAAIHQASLLRWRTGVDPPARSIQRAAQDEQPDRLRCRIRTCHREFPDSSAPPASQPPLVLRATISRRLSQLSAAPFACALPSRIFP